MTGRGASIPHPGALVLSLDLELAWGVRDRVDGGAGYAANLHGARAVVPRLLELFEEFQVAATWAVVGFLFAESRDELERFSPTVRPAYRDPSLSPYGEAVGANEEEDPLHFAPSLIDRIRGTPRQEVATHTFSHYYCGEEGQSPTAFRADLAAARAIAARRGIRFRSIVLPRNQHEPAYDAVLRDEGIRAYRGNPPSRLWAFTDDDGSRIPWKRAGRLLDAYLGPGSRGPVRWAEVPRPTGLSDVRGSGFLRPYDPRLRHLEPARLRRIRRSLRFAAEEGRIFHLWWHPHNFGIHQEENLAFLRGVLQAFAECQRRHRMCSLSMAEVAARVSAAEEGPASGAKRSPGAASPAPPGPAG